MQQRVAQGFFNVGTVPTATNVADLLIGIVSGEFEGETEEWVPVGLGEYEALMMKETGHQEDDLICVALRCLMARAVHQSQRECLRLG